MNYNRIVASRRGGPEVLHMIEDTLPDAHGRQVKIKILAAGVSFADVMIREGVYPGISGFPLTPGYDIVGIVEATGEEVTMVNKGDLVAALTVTGGYAEYILLSEEELVPVPEGVDYAEAVSLVLNYVTAYQMLYRAVKIQRGDSILVYGAAGGVGSAFLQLGALMGLRMYGTASAGKHSLVKSLGGVPIDYQKDDVVKKMRAFVPEGVAAVFDGTGEWVYPSYGLLRPNGTLVVYGTSSMLNHGRKSIGNVFATYLRISIFLKNILPVKKRVVLYQITKYKKLHPDWFREDLKILFDLLKEGKIRPQIAMRQPLADASHCHDVLNRSAITGKMVLVPGENFPGMTKANTR